MGYDFSMVFSKKNAGKWVASKQGKVIDASKKIETLVKRIEKRVDHKGIRFDKVPAQGFVGSSYGI